MSERFIRTPHAGAVQIRTAHAADIPAITQCCIAAFTRFEVFGPPWYSDAGVMPALLQMLPDNLIRVAVDAVSSEIVGVVVWVPRTMHFGRRLIPAAFLAPLAVTPAWQKQGVGTLLLQDGQEMLRRMQVRMLLVLGHDAYYPRVGFLNGCHGRHASTLPAPPALGEDPEGYCLRPLRVGDDVACAHWWHHLCAGTDGAIEPDLGLLPWASHTRGIIAGMLTRNEVPVAYARFDTRPHASTQDGVLSFLAADAEAAHVLAARIVGWTGWRGETLTLPLPSRPAAVRALFPGLTLTACEQRWPAGMAMALDDEEIDQGLRRIQRQEAPPLMVEWPALFDH